MRLCKDGWIMGKDVLWMKDMRFKGYESHQFLVLAQKGFGDGFLRLGNR